MNKVFYIYFNEVYDVDRFVKVQINDFLMDTFELDDESDLANYQLPSDLSTNTAVYNELISLIFARYGDKCVARIVKPMWKEDPTTEEMQKAIKEWRFSLVSLLCMNYEYYSPILAFYRAAKSDMMNDIKATSKNTVKFNDTPQNNNSTSVYEGDNYLTHFTKTENETSSPLTSKIMRLKEIQDNYKNVMADWVKEFERIFIEVQ